MQFPRQTINDIKASLYLNTDINRINVKHKVKFSINDQPVH